MSPCCHTRRGPDPPGTSVRLRGLLAWLLPGTLLALTPKCPACLAAYVALATGIGISIPLATGLRWTLVAACVGSLIWLSLSGLRRTRGLRSLHTLP